MNIEYSKKRLDREGVTKVVHRLTRGHHAHHGLKAGLQSPDHQDCDETMPRKITDAGHISSVKGCGGGQSADATSEGAVSRAGGTRRVS